jgi:hypothetical protein
MRSAIVLSYKQEGIKLQIGPCYACGDRILQKNSFVSFIFKKISDLTSFNNLI